MRTTHTYAKLVVSPATYDEVRGKLLAAGYEHALLSEDDGEVIDMHGIGLEREAREPTR